MRPIWLIALPLMSLLAGCGVRPTETPPAGHGALYPPETTFARTDADVEVLRAKIKAIKYPVAPGETLRQLGVGTSTSGSTEIIDYYQNTSNLVATYRRKVTLNRRYELVVSEDHFWEKDNVVKREVSAEIKPLSTRF